MNRHGRLAKLDLAPRAQVVSLRRHGWTALDICARLGLEKQSELNAVAELCARDKTLRRYQFGMEVGAPVKEGRSGARRPMV